MCELEEIDFKAIVGELMVNSRSKEMWQLWLKRGFHRCGGFQGFAIKYWKKRFHKDNASKNYICSIWNKWYERYREVVEKSQLTEQVEITYETHPEIIEDYCKKIGITVEEYIKQTQEKINYRDNINQESSNDDLEIKPKENSTIVKYPSITTMAQTFAESIVQWAKKGFKVVNEEQFNERLNICRGCELWDSKALNGGGRCRDCGCSTQAKLRIATERCPKDKWVQV
jgi:hypothetical protein